MVGLRQRVARFLMKQAYLPYVGLVALWTCLFVIAPLGIILYFSLLSVGPLGQIIPSFTLRNYLGLFEGAYVVILLRSLAFAFGTNVICLLIGFPLAYWIARYGGRWKTALIFLVIIPSWTCYLIRLYALKTIIGHRGLINSTLLNFNLISSPIDILYTPFAVMLGIVYSWLPFMVLPIYAAVESLDATLLEASEDLGATPFQRLVTVTLPLTKGGIYAGTIFVFIIALGEWLVPLLLGGAKVMMAGSLVEHYFIKAGNIPAGSAIAAAITVIALLVVYLGVKLGGQEVLERVT